MSPSITPAETVVRLTGVSKSFGAARVLADIDLDFRAGEVHAIVGENGAGKSTLGKIVGGYHAADAGRLEVFGTVVEGWTPRKALARGVAMIHQELQLVPGLTVAENVFLGIEENVHGVLRGSRALRFRALDDKCGFGLSGNALVADLRIADRQKVEIMRAVARGARVIVTDEPASSLTDDEAERLHEVIAWLKAGGATIIYVTHFLDHVLAAADRVTVLRDGRLVWTEAVSRATKAGMIEAMLGRSADVAFPAIPPASDPSAAPLLEVRGVATDTGVNGVSLTIRAGEIVSLLGLIGSGRSEVARAIFGADRLTAGEIRIAGRPYRDPRPHRSVMRGVAMSPEDRRKQGLVMTLAARPNMSLPHLAKVSRRGVLDQKEETRRARTLIAHFGIAPPDVDGAVVLYSGGNQQKTLLAKWMYGDPRIVILDEPSRGVDIGARRRIHEFIVELAGNGAAVLLISSELEEALALSHRGYLMSGGRIVGEVDARSVSVGDVLRRLFGAGREPADGASRRPGGHS
jgi:ABC-type sugar transport system ATPase subunit